MREMQLEVAVAVVLASENDAGCYYSKQKGFDLVLEFQSLSDSYLGIAVYHNTKKEGVCTM